MKGDSASLSNATSARAALAASPAGTRRYHDRWAARFVADFFRTSRSELSVSSLAHGTYLGESDDATDALERLLALRDAAVGHGARDA